MDRIASDLKRLFTSTAVPIASSLVRPGSFSSLKARYPKSSTVGSMAIHRSDDSSSMPITCLLDPTGADHPFSLTLVALWPAGATSVPLQPRGGARSNERRAGRALIPNWLGRPGAAAAPVGQAPADRCSEALDSLSRSEANGPVFGVGPEEFGLTFLV